MCKAIQVVRHAVSVACGATFGSSVASGVGREGARGTVGPREAAGSSVAFGVGREGARGTVGPREAAGVWYRARQGFA
eukprot:2029765-Pleurochrysis_carterae.AAC.1